MISFCKSSFHTILGIQDSDDRRNIPLRRSHTLPSPDSGGLRLLTADSPKPPHVVEYSAVRPLAAGETSPDPGAWGLHEAAPPARALSLCTESLGSESCDSGIEIDESTAEIEQRNARRPSRRGREEIRFPPPLQWMNGLGGRRRRYLKAERRDGRFVLTEIEIHQPPEILRAVRIGGRLRLELVEIAGEDGLEGEESPEKAEIAGEDGLGEEEESMEKVEIAGEDGLEGEEESPEKAEIAGEESPEKVEIAGEEESEKVEIAGEGRSPENGERWELLRVWKEGKRCVEARSGDGVTPLWWNHRFATTA